MKSAPAQQDPAARTIPSRSQRVAPTTTPPAPGAPALNVQAPQAVPAPPSSNPQAQGAPAVQPAVPAAQQPPAANQTVPPAPPVPAIGQAVPAAQVQGAAQGPAKAVSQTLPAGFLTFQNAPPEQWMEFYENLVGRTILRANALPATHISLRSQTDLTREEAIQAFEHVLTLNGITAVRIGEKFVELVPSAQALQSGGAFNKDSTGELPEAAQFVTQIVQLKHVLPSEASQAVNPFARTPNGIIAIDSTQTLVIRDYAINVKRMVEVLDEIDKEIPLEVELELIPIRYALVADVSAVLGTLTSSGSITPAGSGSAASRTGTSSTRRTTGGNRGSLGVNTGFGGNTGGINNQGGLNPQQRTGTTITPPGGAAGAVSSFQSNLQRIVQNASRGTETPLLGDAKIIPDERSNSLIVFGTKQEREMIKKIIKELDIVQPQVLIEAVIVEVQLNDGKDTGVSFGQQPKQFAKDFTGFGGSSTTVPFGSSFTNVANPLSQLTQGFSYFGQLGTSWELALNAVANDSRFEVLSRPRVQASHAYEAEIFVGETRPFPTGSVSFGGQATTQIQNQQIGIRLNVLPLINIDGVVVLDIAQTVDQIGDEIQVDQFLRVPSIVARSATSRVTVKNGDTIILGGFITSEKRQTKSGIPGLKDIPGLGRLFSSRSDSLVKRELIVLLRPTVLETPEVAAVAEREKMVDVKKTEVDLREAEEARYRKLEEEMRRQMQRKK